MAIIRVELWQAHAPTLTRGDWVLGPYSQDVHIVDDPAVWESVLSTKVCEVRTVDGILWRRLRSGWAQCSMLIPVSTPNSYAVHVEKDRGPCQST